MFAKQFVSDQCSVCVFCLHLLCALALSLCLFRLGATLLLRHTDARRVCVLTSLMA